MSVIHATNANFNEIVLGSDIPVLVDFFATWCGPCRMIAPILEEISEERDDIKICKVNIDDEIDLAARYQIVSIPTLVFVEDGEEISRSVGARPKAQILSLL